jgi:hypothetical protein
MEYLLIFIGAIVAGFCGAGIVLLVNLLIGRRLPGYSVAIAAGASMLAMTLYLEYDWFDRRVAELPPGVEVVWHNDQSQIWRPWTYIFPLTTRFIAMDSVNIGTNAARPDTHIVDMLFVQRWTPDRLSKVVFDCATGQSAKLTPEAIFHPDGTVEGVDWDPVNPEDPVIQTVCSGGENHGDGQTAS